MHHDLRMERQTKGWEEGVGYRNHLHIKTNLTFGNAFFALKSVFARPTAGLEFVCISVVVIMDWGQVDF